MLHLYVTHINTEQAVSPEKDVEPKELTTIW